VNSEQAAAGGGQSPLPATGHPPSANRAEEANTKKDSSWRLLRTSRPLREPFNSSLETRHSLLVKVYPDIALGILRGERAAAGRVWLLLRHADAAGRGWLALDEVRMALCGKDSQLRLCGWRRLRQLLAEGEGVFWTRDERDRLWLRGPARVAGALGVGRLRGRPVGMPIAALLGGIGDARAQLYATFHSGRLREGWYLSRGAGEQGSGGASGKWQVASSREPCHPPPATRHLPPTTGAVGSPISRDTLAELSGVCPRSQAAYERRAGVTARANIALGERVTAHSPIGPAEQERAWRAGRALFRLKDYRGRHGRPGAVYLAWRLPNGYSAARGHQQRPKGQQKRVNRQLADLFTKGMTGNGERPIEKRFFGTAGGAIRNYELRIANAEFGARSPLGTRHSGPATRHWPLRGVGRGGGVGVWTTITATAGCRPPSAKRAAARACEIDPAADTPSRLKPVAAAGNLLQRVPLGGGLERAVSEPESEPESHTSRGFDSAAPLRFNSR
jgi:hypothetical protein